MNATTDPQAQAAKAAGRQSASISALGRRTYSSTRMIAPIGGRAYSKT
jgi:hypothetical protein